MITTKELRLFLIAIAFGVANWFIMSGVKDWFVVNFPDVNTVMVGLLIMFALIAIYKYRGVFNLT